MPAVSQDLIDEAWPIRRIWGRHWFNKVMPGRIFGLSDEGWVDIHPTPDRPDPEASMGRGDPQSKTFKRTVEMRDRLADLPVRAMAVQSPYDNNFYAFQTWRGLHRCRLPWSNNCCMHMEVFLADALAPGESTTMNAVLGVHHGGLSSLRQNTKRLWQQD